RRLLDQHAASAAQEKRFLGDCENDFPVGRRLDGVPGNDQGLEGRLLRVDGHASRDAVNRLSWGKLAGGLAEELGRAVSGGKKKARRQRLNQDAATRIVQFPPRSHSGR